MEASGEVGPLCPRFSVSSMRQSVAATAVRAKTNAGSQLALERCEQRMRTALSLDHQ